MLSPIPDYLTEVLDVCGGDDSGELADYIPELALADPDRFALALATVDGTVYAVGDDEVELTIQSISKPFAYALAIARHGIDAVLEKVGVEPSGDAFNELSLEVGTGRPFNPMINAGALTVHALIDDETVLRGFSAFAGRRLEVDERVFASELVTADRNRAIAFMLRSHGIVEQDAQQVVEGYTRQCSVLVTVRDLALMAATLANDGVQPVTGQRVVPHGVTRQVMAVMATCGMYDAAGDWFSSVGIPAKSGVAGGLIGALPGQVGLATFSPRLDRHGNSVRGVQVFERLSREMGMHLMEVPPPARSVVHDRTEVAGSETGHGWTYELQGSLNFAGMERVLRNLVDEPPTDPVVVLDLTRVHEIREVGRRMLLEAVRRLALDGHDVTLVDPEGLLQAFPGDHEDGQLDAGDAILVPVTRRPLGSAR